MALGGSNYMLVQQGTDLRKTTLSDMVTYMQDQLGTVEYTAADITARDATSLTNTLSVGDRVFVTDASGDATVSSGWGIYRWNGSSYTKIAEQETLDVSVTTNLGYTSSATNGTVTSSTGADATLPAATASIAGLLLPADFTKLGYISVTSAVDLNNDFIAASGGDTFSGTVDGGTSGNLAAQNTTVTNVTGTLSGSTHRNRNLILSGNVTVPASSFSAYDTIVLEPNGSDRTITAGAGLTLYQGGASVSSFTLPAEVVGQIWFRSATTAIAGFMDDGTGDHAAVTISTTGDADSLITLSGQVIGFDISALTDA